MFTDQRILVTGGTGCLGYELVRQLLLQQPRRITVYSRNESAQMAMKRAFSDARLGFRIGDIRDKEALAQACRETDYVFHLAALKPIPICEDRPHEALKTNVIGTQNVIEAAITNQVKRVIYMSTVKAANPSSFYGMTKAIGEKLVVYANLLRSDTTFVCVRGSDLLGADCSVIPFIMNRIRAGRRVPIADMRMTRHFVTPQDAVELLFQASAASLGGETFVMTTPACRIADLARVMMDDLGIRAELLETGVPPVEKIHEIQLTEHEGDFAIVYDDHFLVLLPAIDFSWLRDHYNGFARFDYDSFWDVRPLMSDKDIHAMLKRGGLL